MLLALELATKICPAAFRVMPEGPASPVAAPIMVLAGPTLPLVKAAEMRMLLLPKLATYRGETKDGGPDTMLHAVVNTTKSNSRPSAGWGCLRLRNLIS